LNGAARTLASLALEKIRRNGSLGVRQEENLRRALVLAGGAFRWDALPGSSDDRGAVATIEATELADFGAQLLDQDLVKQVEAKRGEIPQIRKAIRTLRALAAGPDLTCPVEVHYTHTVKSAAGTLLTKTVTLILKDAAGAGTSADSLEKRMDALARLSDQMHADLKDRRMQIRSMRKRLPEFVESSSGLLAELLAISA